MLESIYWIFAIEVIGLAAFPLAFALFPKLTDRGYTTSKILGIIIIGYISWILSVLHILPSVRVSLIILVLIMASLSIWYILRNKKEFLNFFVSQYKVIILSEILFLLVITAWTVYRSYDPSINHTEQPMDFAFLNASIQSYIGFPEDPWLEGHAISYYYFGYWMMGVISEMTGIASNISYNLSLSLIPALLATGVFGLVYNLTSSNKNFKQISIIAGLIVTLLISVSGNLEGILELMRTNGIGSFNYWNWIHIKGMEIPIGDATHGWLPQEFWWWFRASRVINSFEGLEAIDFTIQEFPFFSFLLGDLHPHLMSLPFVILFISLCWHWFLSTPQPPNILKKKQAILVLLMGLLLGGLAFTNLWDLPTFWTLFLVLAAVKSYQFSDGRMRTILRQAVPVSLAVLGIAILLYLPYFLTFRGSVSGILPVTVATRPVHTFIVWGLFMITITPFLIGVFCETRLRSDWRRTSMLGLTIGFTPYIIWALLYLTINSGSMTDILMRLLLISPFALLLSIAVFNVFWLAKEEASESKLFAVILSGLGILLIMGSDLLFIRDSFNTRMNTVFKLYFQAWILLAIASGFALYYWKSIRDSASGWKLSLANIWAVVFVAVFVASLYYAPAAVVAKSEGFSNDPTLDGLDFLKERSHAEYEAITFLKGKASSESTLVEAVGEWFDYGLISRSTGIPSVFNWHGHQLQWRGESESFKIRQFDITRIYETLDIEEAKIILSKYNINYVYIGPREREIYDVSGFKKFPAFMDEIFNRSGVKIYESNR